MSNIDRDSMTIVNDYLQSMDDYDKHKTLMKLILKKIKYPQKYETLFDCDYCKELVYDIEMNEIDPEDNEFICETCYDDMLKKENSEYSDYFDSDNERDNHWQHGNGCSSNDNCYC